jgi:hypothetical protein
MFSSFLSPGPSRVIRAAAFIRTTAARLAPRAPLTAIAVVEVCSWAIIVPIIASIIAVLFAPLMLTPFVFPPLGGASFPAFMFSPLSTLMTVAVPVTVIGAIAVIAVPILCKCRRRSKRRSDSAQHQGKNTKFFEHFPCPLSKALVASCYFDGTPQSAVPPKDSDPLLTAFHVTSLVEISHTCWWATA